MRTAESASIDSSLDLDTLRDVLREHPVRLAILFGSHATERANPASDGDIAVAFEGVEPADPRYNDVYLGLSADLSDALETDDVDLVDLHGVSSSLAAAIFESGILIVGERDTANALARDLQAGEADGSSARERFETALDRIDAHLEGTDSAAGQWDTHLSGCPDL